MNAAVWLFFGLVALLFVAKVTCIFGKTICICRRLCCRTSAERKGYAPVANKRDEDTGLHVSEEHLDDLETIQVLRENVGPSVELAHRTLAAGGARDDDDDDDDSRGEAEKGFESDEWASWAEERADSSLLFYMAKDNETAKVRALLEAGADPNMLVGNPTSKRSPLHKAMACRGGGDRDEVIRLLVEAGADIDMQTAPEGWTPLIEAARAGCEANVAALLARGADKDVVDAKSETALTHAARNGHEQIVRLLQQAVS